MNNVNLKIAVPLALAVGLVVGFVSVPEAGAQSPAPKAKVKAANKAALKQALTVDTVTLETQARAKWDALTAAKEALAAAEAAVAAETPGTVEYDIATEAWLTAQGVIMVAQEDFNVAGRELENARAMRGAAAATFVEDRCANDDGKNANIKRICDRLNAVKVEEAARAAAIAAGTPLPPPQ